MKKNKQDLSTMQYVRFTFAYKNLLKHLDNDRVLKLFKITKKEYDKRFN